MARRQEAGQYAYTVGSPQHGARLEGTLEEAGTPHGKARGLAFVADGGGGVVAEPVGVFKVGVYVAAAAGWASD